MYIFQMFALNARLVGDALQGRGRQFICRGKSEKKKFEMWFGMTLIDVDVKKMKVASSLHYLLKLVFTVATGTQENA